MKRKRKIEIPQGLEPFADQARDYESVMPRNKPGVRETAQAKATLLAHGMNIVNRGFDPNMN